MPQPPHRVPHREDQLEILLNILAGGIARKRVATARVACTLDESLVGEGSWKGASLKLHTSQLCCDALYGQDSNFLTSAAWTHFRR